MIRTLKLCAALLAAIFPQLVLAASDDQLSGIRIVDAPSDCSVTKLLAQADLGEGYVVSPPGTSNRAGFFLPSMIFRAGVGCVELEEGWEVGFIQGVFKYEFQGRYSTGTFLAKLIPVPIADTIRVSTGLFRAVVSRKPILRSESVTVEHQDQPRYLIPWLHESEGASGANRGLNFTDSEFVATSYLVMIHPASHRLALLRQIRWESGLRATCEPTKNLCAFAIKTRAPVAIERPDAAGFPRQILTEPVAANIGTTSSWVPRNTKAEKGSASN